MTTESELRETLRKIEALFAGAATAGERDAARAARERIQAKLRDFERREHPVEMRFTWAMDGTSSSSWRSAGATA